MKNALAAVALIAAVLLGATARAADRSSLAPTLEEDGIYSQSWFVKSFLDLKEDLADASAAGKRLVVIFEQRGCPYCREMHTGHLTDPRINAYIRQHFAILQINIHGDREVTDFDGAKMPEKELARRWGARFTPTFVFLPEKPDPAAAKTGQDIEVLRMRGLLKPGPFYAMFKFVEQRKYAGQSLTQFQAGEGAALAREIDEHPLQ